MTRKHDENLDDESYEIKDELEIRKIIESHTDWYVETAKNDDRYGFDLKFYRWDDEPESLDDRVHGGFIELECASPNSKYPWYDEDPPEDWHFLSFLKRKVYNYNWDANSWEDLRDEHHRTLYMKWNIPRTSCFVVPITTIYKDGTPTKHSDGSYTNSYLQLDDSHPDVTFGIQDGVDFIEEYLSSFEDGQESLFSFELEHTSIQPDGGAKTTNTPPRDESIQTEYNLRCEFSCDGCGSMSPKGVYRELTSGDELRLCCDCLSQSDYGGDGE